MRRRSVVAALAVACLGTLGQGLVAEGAPFFIDQFSVVKNGNLLFTDPFTDGFPPPSAPNFENGNPASYIAVGGTLNEAGGRVRLDTAGAEIVPGIGVPIPFFLERAILQTNIDPANRELGLKDEHTFSMTAIYDLGVPGQNLEFYGIRFTDGTGPNTANDLLHLGVRRGADGMDRVQFFRLDDVLSTFEAFAGSILEPMHDQIRLTLERLDAASDAITASFAYIDGGMEGALVTFGPTADIFHGENFTRAEFIFFTPVPAPGPSALLLLGFGLAGTALVCRRFRG